MVLIAFAQNVIQIILDHNPKTKFSLLVLIHTGIRMDFDWKC